MHRRHDGCVAASGHRTCSLPQEYRRPSLLLPSSFHRDWTGGHSSSIQFATCRLRVGEVPPCVHCPRTFLLPLLPFQLGAEVVSIARIQRGPSEAARWASTETTSVAQFLPSLPSRHFIALLLQAAIDEVRIGLAGLRRAGNDLEETREEPPDRTTRCADHRPSSHSS